MAKTNPGAGIHFQGSSERLSITDDLGLTSIECRILNRDKDAGTATSDWFAELMSDDPWWKDIVPNVRLKDDRPFVVY